MTVYFYNEGVIDLNTIRTMGVSVKDTDNPIGYFGTGLKYAIATLLRTGHKITLKAGDTYYSFATQKIAVRGKDFDIVHMNEEQLGFTTDLGKDWEVWMAYRELASNVIDEGGHTSTMPPRDDNDSGTLFKVIGKEITDAHQKRSDVFCEGYPEFTDRHVEIHSGPSGKMFYRGIRVQELELNSMFTYNVMSDLILTEDRTIKYDWEVKQRLSRVLPSINNRNFAERLIFCRGYWEETLDFTRCSDPSEAFLDAVADNFNNLQISMSARDLLKKHRPMEIEGGSATKQEEQTITEAVDMAAFLGAKVGRDDITVVEDLGQDIMALMKDKKIYITKRCIANGTDFLAITLYEEWIHRDLGYYDESRSMQQYLFDKILYLAKELRNAEVS